MNWAGLVLTAMTAFAAEPAARAADSDRTSASARPTRTSRLRREFRCGAMVPGTTCCRRARSIR